MTKNFKTKEKRDDAVVKELLFSWMNPTSKKCITDSQ